VLFDGLVLIAGALRPGYSVIRDVISDLGAGPGGWIQNANFAVFGVLLVVFAVGFHAAMRPMLSRGALRLCLVLLVLSGLGLLVAAAFPVALPDEPPALQMRKGLLHMAGFLTIFLPLVAALFTVGLRLRGEPGWRGYARYSLATGGATLLLLVAMFVVASPDSPWPIGGLASRVLVVVAFAWHAATGWRLSREEEA
jgi:hypothetical membrane protein